MKIHRGKTEFLLGITSPLQLENWLRQHPQIRGVALIGRSNVGKSSLINAIFGDKTARTSKTPGRTQQVNIFSFCCEEDKSVVSHDPLFIFDLPGYGFAQVSKEMGKNWSELMHVFFSTVSENVLLLNLQDARHPMTESDRDFDKFIKDFSLLRFVIFNKMDKLKTQSEKAQLKKQMATIFKAYKKVKQIYFVSAESKMGLVELEAGFLGMLLKNQA
jgi:GTP-binding protein